MHKGRLYLVYDLMHCGSLDQRLYVDDGGGGAIVLEHNRMVVAGRKPPPKVPPSKPRSN